MRPSMVLATLGMTAVAYAGTQTYVSLAGRDDAIPKLGRPAIALSVAVPNANDAAYLTTELSRELAQQVHTRRLAPGEAGDYDLIVTVAPARVDGPVVTVPFEAVLKSGQGGRLWRIEGRADVDGAPLEASVFVGIGRNVVSALIHEGWVQPRYDPDNPPPQPPRIRSE
jgi:hypothetical protein